MPKNVAVDIVLFFWVTSIVSFFMAIFFVAKTIHKATNSDKTVGYIAWVITVLSVFFFSFVSAFIATATKYLFL